MELNKIYLGDCYKLIKQIEDKSVDCIYTDVPYLYNQGGFGHSDLGKRQQKKRLELMNNNLENGFDYAILNEFIRVMKKVNCFIWCSKLQIRDIMNFFVDKSQNYELLIWCKTNPSPTTNNTWLPDLEYCLYFREKGVLLNDGYELKSKFYVSPLNKSDKDEFDHPTIKPYELIKRHLMHATQKGDVILDPFLGSGTTCVAAKELGRQYIGFEINEKYFNIAKDRLNGINQKGQTSLFDTDFEQMDLFEEKTDV